MRSWWARSTAAYLRVAVILGALVTGLIQGGWALVAAWALLMAGLMAAATRPSAAGPHPALVPPGNEHEGSGSPQPEREAALLLRRLDVLAGSLDGGFDAPTCAELVIDAVDDRVRAVRRGVLVGYGDDPAVPLALRGADRVPWTDPQSPATVLGRVWASAEPEIGISEGGAGLRAVLAVPLLDPTGQRFGVLVLDREASLPFSSADLLAAAEVASRVGPSLDVALLFAALRARAAFEERERLAREMHDGIAQELVALGYGIDALRREASSQGSPLAEPLGALRRDLSGVLGDLRLRIGDLRIPVRPDRGLGALVGDRLQRFGSATGLGVVLRLNESGFRLSAHAETLIYRLVLDVLADARHAPGATSVDLTLDVAAPQAFLRIVHDGRSSLRAEDFVDHPLTALGAEILVERSDHAGVVLQFSLRHRHPPAHVSLSEQRIPQRS